MQYSLHITLCSTIFNICLFDQASGVVSKDYDLKDEDDFKMFVRIICHATCDMDAYKLGLDPTVTPLDYLGSIACYPRFKVEVGETTYHTYSFPIWQSVTLQGRGTWVFGATKENNPNPNPCESGVEERLEGLWASSRVDALQNYQQAQGTRQHTKSSLCHQVCGWQGRNDWRRRSTGCPYYLLRHNRQCRQSVSRDASFQSSRVCQGCRIEPP